MAQVGSIALDGHDGLVVAASAEPPAVGSTAPGRRQMRELASSTLPEAWATMILARLKVLRQQAGRGHRADGCRATGRAWLEWLRALGESLQPRRSQREGRPVSLYDGSRSPDRDRWCR